MRYGWEESLDRWLTHEPGWRYDDDEEWHATHEEYTDDCDLCEQEARESDGEEADLSGVERPVEASKPMR
jgi:hypothetical protein